MKLINNIINSIRAAANYNPEAEYPPQCILWTDKEKLWEKAVEVLKGEMPELLVLGEYKPEVHMGPAIWLRVAISGLIDSYKVPIGKVPVLYLPGVSRQDIRAVESCSEELMPLAELQYRGVIWSQINSRDWTPLAYLKTKKGGLGLNIQQDTQTIEALERALVKLLFEEIDSLKNEYLDKDYFNALLTGGDTIRDVLNWINDPDSFKKSKSDEEWEAFVEICISKFQLNPEQDTIYTAAEKIAWKEPQWDSVWDRFCEAPAKYNAIPQVMRNIIMPLGIEPDRSPQWNDQQESALRKELKLLVGLAEHNARDRIIELEKTHGERRNFVWAASGDAPLAEAMYWLSIIAEHTQKIITGNITEIIKAYEDWGWKVDNAVSRALQLVKKQEDIDAITNAIRSIYISWIDECARNLQKAIATNPIKSVPNEHKPGECILFVDGLRFDMAKQVSENLTALGYDVMYRSRLSELPSLTATCKPALMPIADELIGLEVDNEDFCPVIKESNQKALSQRLESLMNIKGWKVLKHGDYRKEIEDNAWLDYSHIDEDGHSLGWRIVQNFSRYIDEVVEKVEILFANGWSRVKILSDHGWLMMPGGLPKVNIAASLVDSKWGRTAAAKPGALLDGNYYQWYWNPNVHFVLAEGAGCYRANTEYTHGGISLQENILLDLLISAPKGNNNALLTITDIVWKGMRCKVAAEGQFEDLRLDIRTKPAMPETSIVMGVKEFPSDGITSVVVDDDIYEGKSAFLVVLDENDKVVYQIATIIGGEQ